MYLPKEHSFPQQSSQPNHHIALQSESPEVNPEDSKNASNGDGPA